MLQTSFFLKQTLKLAHRFGQLNHWAQAGGGNLSVKTKHQLWISRSGVALHRIQAQPDLVQLDLKAKAFSRWSQGCLSNWDKVQDEIDQQTRDTPKPSMEIGMHLLAGTCNLHLHLVRANALSCSIEGWQALLKVAKQEDWCMAPYQMPGPNLAKALQQEKGKKSQLPEVTILKNHGLLLSAASPDALSKLLFYVAKRIDQLFSSPFVPSNSLSINPKIDLQQSALHKRTCYHLPHQPLQAEGPITELTPDGVVYLQPIWQNQEQGSGPMPLNTRLFEHQENFYFATENKHEAKAAQSVLDAQIQIANQIDDQSWTIDPLPEEEVNRLLAWKEYAQATKNNFC